MLGRWIKRRRVRDAQHRAGFNSDANPINMEAMATSLRRNRAELAELDRRLDAGEITQEQYDRRRAEGWTVKD